VQKKSPERGSLGRNRTFSLSGVSPDSGKPSCSNARVKRKRPVKTSITEKNSQNAQQPISFVYALMSM